MSAPRPLKNVGRRFCAPGCRRLLVYRGGAFLGVVRLTDVADAMAGPPGRMDLVLNLVGGFTFLLAVGVIAMLLYELPAMLHVAGQLGR